MSIEHLVADLDEAIELADSGANVGGFPCGVVAGIIFVLVD